MSDLIEQIKSKMRITDYLTSAGYHLVRHGGQGKLHLKEHDSFIIDPEQNRFWWNSHDVHGGIIDLVMVMEGVDQKEAISRLAKQLNQPRQIKTAHNKGVPVEPATTPDTAFVPPKVEAKYWPRIYGYLIKRRGIDPAVVKWLEKSKLIYPTEYANLCYVNLNQEGKPDYAAMKGTGTNAHFRKVVGGGNFEGRAFFNLVGTKPTAWFVCEAAVDAFSIMTLLHRNGIDWRKYAYLSLEGCYAGPLRYHLARSPPPAHIWLAQDADEAGMQSRAACRKLLAEVGYAGVVEDKIPPLGKDWNDTLCQPPAPSIKQLCQEARQQAAATNAKRELSPTKEEAVIE